MATISTRTSKKGVTTFRVGYYERGRFRQMPAMLSETGALRIKAIIEDPAQGPDVARRLLEAHADGAEDVIRVPWPGGEITERREVRREIVALYDEACARLGVTPRPHA